MIEGIYFKRGRPIIESNAYFLIFKKHTNNINCRNTDFQNITLCIIRTFGDNTVIVS